MRIAVVGGLGFIGIQFSEYAVARGHRVLVYDTVEYNPGEKDLFQYHRIADVQNGQEEQVDADAVVILAAKRPYQGFDFEDYNNNVMIAERWFQTARYNRIDNIVFASSKAVFSDQSSIPWTEEEYTSPLSLYGASKVAVEQIASFLNDHEGMCIKCLRFAQVIGLGERKGFLINTLIDRAREKKQQVVYGDGSQKRQYIYIKDVCGAILAALEHKEEKGVFNIGMSGAVTNLELAECVNSVFNNEGNLICDPSKPMGSFCDEMKVEKAEKRIEWKPQYGLRELFADIARTEEKVAL